MDKSQFDYPLQPDDTRYMYTGTIYVELYLPDCHSLKEKRSPIRRFIEHIRQSYQVSVAEVQHQDLWQKAGIGIALCSGQRGTLEKVLQTIRQDIEGNPHAIVVRIYVNIQ